MDSQYPIHTLISECHDCYKCVRECYVKAIKIENGHASVLPEKCIACGHCVTVCPQQAKKVRNDIKKLENLLCQNKKVYVSLAPSWAGVFNSSEEVMITALKKLGFANVSETALGAQQVSAKVSQVMAESSQKLYISSACPAVVDYIRIYNSKYTGFLTQIASPALTHAKMLKNLYGNDIAIVFIGPCIAKKNEADSHPELIDAALTFKELQYCFDKNNICLHETINSEKAVFIPEKAYEGSIYPVEGGMNKTLKLINKNRNVQLLNVSSIASLDKYLKNLKLSDLDKKIFIEALACEGGCTNGPCINTDKSGLAVISDILSKVQFREKVPAEAEFVVNEKFEPLNTEQAKFKSSEITYALKSIGKYAKEDELDCGGCGYDTCKKLAEALVAGTAETSMCVSYMRKIALQKANSMLRCMPSAVVMVDKNYKIVESNKTFVKTFAKEIYEYYSSKPEGIAGAALDRLVPCIELFSRALKTGKDVHKERYSIDEKLYDITVFTIEPNQIVGAILTDVTKTEIKREQISRRAQEVITKNIAIVQNIACLLGEHMVETELLLGSIAEGYDTESNRSDKND